nr:serine hydrolase domain-containing protein [uncultured Duganella sp.]
MNKYFIIGCLVLLPFTVQANDLAAFDKIFSDVNSPDKPAVAVALLKKDKVIYQKSFGSTNLEYKAAATVDTKFQVDTLAWEFIAYATLLLETQGKIRLDDDIRKYLPELPAFDHKITINHLLSSTDGIYGYKVLKSLAGWDSKEAGQQQAVMQLIKRQKALNFRPGTEFSPGGNTRLVLLANIVEVVSGQSFDVFCKTHIFDPLGMTNTLFVYDDQTLLQNVAVPYRDAGKGVYKLDYGRAAGPVNLYSSIKDLALWRSSVLSRAADVATPDSKLGGVIKLDNGVIIKDISSISIYGQQHVGKERGIPKIYQIGSFGGYASSIFRFPEQEITVIVLSSGLAYNGSYGMRLAATLLKNDFLEAETIDYGKIQRVNLHPGQLHKFEGNYWNKERAIPAKAYVRNGILYYSRVEGTERELIPLDDNVFQMRIEGDDHYHMKFEGGNMHFSMSGSDPIIFEPHTLAHYTKNELAQFAGHFYSEELDSSFVLSADNGILTASNLRTGLIHLKPVKTDVFYGNKSFMAGIQFKRGKNDEIVGFQVAVDEVRNLEFKKIRAVE